MSAAAKKAAALASSFASSSVVAAAAATEEEQEAPLSSLLLAQSSLFLPGAASRSEGGPLLRKWEEEEEEEEEQRCRRRVLPLLLRRRLRPLEQHHPRRPFLKCFPAAPLASRPRARQDRQNPPGEAPAGCGSPLGCAAKASEGGAEKKQGERRRCRRQRRQPSSQHQRRRRRPFPRASLLLFLFFSARPLEAPPTSRAKKKIRAMTAARVTLRMGCVPELFWKKKTDKGEEEERVKRKKYRPSDGRAHSFAALSHLTQGQSPAPIGSPAASRALLSRSSFVRAPLFFQVSSREIAESVSICRGSIEGREQGENEGTRNGSRAEKRKESKARLRLTIEKSIINFLRIIECSRLANPAFPCLIFPTCRTRNDLTLAPRLFLPWESDQLSGR